MELLMMIESIHFLIDYALFMFNYYIIGIEKDNYKDVGF